MSKLSPYRPKKQLRKEASPLSTHYDNTSSYQDLSRSNKQTHNPYTKFVNQNDSPGVITKGTQKKKYDNVSSYDLQNLLQKNRSLSGENLELYQMLQERGRIVNALEQKLQEQMYRQVKTLQEIEQEKNKFINDSHKKFKEYERKIEDLIRQIYCLNEEKYQQNIAKAQEIDIIKDSLSQEQKIKAHEITLNQLSAREYLMEQDKAKALLDLKNKEIQELAFEYQSCIEQLKQEIVQLHKQIDHLQHLRKIELSEQKIMHDRAMENMVKEHSKQKELIAIEHDLLVKKLEQLVSSKQIQTTKLGDLMKIEEIAQNAREQELIQKKNKLEEEIRVLEEFYRKKSVQEAKNIKEIKYGEMTTLQKGNNAAVENLKEQIENLINLNDTKSKEITKLYQQIESQRLQTAETTKNLETIIDELKLKMKDMKDTHSCQLEQLKSKWAQLSQADMATIKKYYTNELQVLQLQLHEKGKLADSNRQKLHQQLQDKNQMRKRYDLQVLKLNSRISELELFISQLKLTKNEEATSLNAAMNMTSQKLLREATDKQRINQNFEEEKKKLQEIITSKDKQIEELNQKIELLKQNYQKQIVQKTSETEIVKKHKEDLEMELKKEKYFYESQLKKKDGLIKSNKEYYESEANIIKEKFRKKEEDLTNEMTSQIHSLEVEVNRLRTVQKTLKNQIVSLKHQQTTEISDKKQELQVQKGRHEQEKKSLQDKLKTYYKEEIGKLQKQIQELEKQLAYKEEDIRGMHEKYHQLEQKMEAVLESQNKLRNIEQNILHLGLSNNVIKNFTEIIQPNNLQ